MEKCSEKEDSDDPDSIFISAGLGHNSNSCPFLAFGCNRQQNIPPENISRVQVEMTSDQVRQLLGNPAKWEQEGMETEWKYYTSQGKLEVKFQNDRVIRLETH